jgi:hypothetical protein
MAGLRELEERVIALEKKVVNPCATCGLKEWVEGDFAKFVNGTQQQGADLKFNIDTNQDKEKVITNGIHTTSNADLRLIVDLQEEVKKNVEMVNSYMDYTKKLYQWCKNHVK